MSSTHTLVTLASFSKRFTMITMSSLGGFGQAANSMDKYRRNPPLADGAAVGNRTRMVKVRVPAAAMLKKVRVKTTVEKIV